MVDPTVSNNSSGPLIACSGLGTADQASCCFANQQAGPVCQAIFSSQELKLFEKGCPSQDCTADCANLTQLYSSTLQEDLGGDGSGPRTRFAACANVPSVARAASDRLLSANISAIAERYISPSAGAEELRKTTAAVTECLSSTCGNARRRDLCFDDYCSPTRLLINNKSPNITAVNNCLSKLCSMGNFNALPYADADVVGIGVRDLAIPEYDRDRHINHCNS